MHNIVSGKGLIDGQSLAWLCKLNWNSRLFGAVWDSEPKPAIKDDYQLILREYNIIMGADSINLTRLTLLLFLSVPEFDS